MNMKDEAGLACAILSVQQAVILAYKDNCPFKPVRSGKTFSEADIRVEVP
jgi:acyl-CoA hydrolase